MIKSDVVLTLQLFMRFAEILQSDDLTKDGICQIIGLNLDAGALSEVAIFELDANATFTFTGSFGPRFGKIDDHVTFPLDANSPAGDAMLNNKNVWLKNSKQMFSEYPDSIYLPDAEMVGFLAAIPIYRLGTLVGCLVVEGKEQDVNPHAIAALELISALIGLKLLGLKSITQNHQDSKLALLHLPLTVREHLIQEMMKAGRTNSQCAIDLGYSESTIRQDSVSMFAKLGVKNRKAAGALLI